MFDPELRDHLLIMKRYLPLILGGAAALGFLVWLVQNRATPVYEAVSTVQLELDVIDEGLVTDFQAAQFTQIVTAPTKLTEIGQRLSYGPLDDETVEDRLELEQRSIPGFIDLTGQGSTGDEAAELANVAADVLVETISSSRVASTPGSDTTATILGRAVAPEAPVAPKPLRDAVLAGLVSLIVLAEGSVLFTKVRGRVSLADPAGNVERATKIPTFTIDDEEHYNQAIMPLYVNSLAKEASVVVVQRGAGPSSTIATQIANAASLVGRSVALVDANLSGAQFLALEPRADFTVASVTAVSNESEALLAVSRLPHAVVLVCDPDAMAMSEIVTLARTIPGVGGNLIGIILNQPGGLTDKMAAAFKKVPAPQQFPQPPA